jgi:hypothetical protein
MSSESSEEMRRLACTLISLVARGGNKVYRRLVKRGISPLYFPDEYADVWQYYGKMMDEEGRVPSIDEVDSRFNIVIDSTTPSSKLDDIVQSISSGLAEVVFGKGMEPALQACRSGDLNGALLAAENQIRRVKGLHIGGAKASPLYSFADEVVGLYERANRGDLGIPFPWPTMNSCTMGMWERTLTLFVARPGVGKTMSSLIVAKNARERADVDILYISPEMFKWEIAERNLAMESKVNYGRMIQGRFRPDEEERFRKQVMLQKETVENGWWIVDRADIITAKDDLLVLESLIEDHKLKSLQRGKKLLVIMDALYKLGRGRDRTEQMVENILWAVRMGIQFNVAILATTQFNRTAGAGGKEASLESLGLTDVAAWEAHQIFALIRDEDAIAAKQMIWKLLKVRRLAAGGAKEFRSFWDFDTMAFGEVARASEFREDDYARAVDPEVKY